MRAHRDSSLEQNSDKLLKMGSSSHFDLVDML